MALTEKEYQRIGNILMLVQKIFMHVMTMDFRERDKLILQTLISMGHENDTLSPIKEACEKTLEAYPNGVDYFETTLVKEMMQRLEHPYKGAVKTDPFDCMILVYGWFDNIIDDYFQKIYALPLDRKDKVIIDNLRRAVRCTLIDNPNFKGENPYYKRFPHQYDAKLQAELVKGDFDGYIPYFKGENDSEADVQ